MRVVYIACVDALALHKTNSLNDTVDSLTINRGVNIFKTLFSLFSVANRSYNHLKNHLNQVLSYSNAESTISAKRMVLNLYGVGDFKECPVKDYCRAGMFTNYDIFHNRQLKECDNELKIEDQAYTYMDTNNIAMQFPPATFNSVTEAFDTFPSVLFTNGGYFSRSNFGKDAKFTAYKFKLIDNIIYKSTQPIEFEGPISTHVRRLDCTSVIVRHYYDSVELIGNDESGSFCLQRCLGLEAEITQYEADGLTSATQTMNNISISNHGNCVFLQNGVVIIPPNVNVLSNDVVVCNIFKNHCELLRMNHLAIPLHKLINMFDLPVILDSFPIGDINGKANSKMDTTVNGFDYVPAEPKAEALARIDHLKTRIAWVNTKYTAERTAVNSILEAYHYNLKSELDIIQRFNLILALKGKISAMRATSKYSIFNTVSQRFYNDPPDVICKYAWDGNKFVDAIYDKVLNTYSVDTKESIVVFAIEIEFLRDKEIIKVFEANEDLFLNYDYEKVKLNLRDEVAGSGKSYYIWNHHKAGADIILTSGKAASLDFLAKNKNIGYAANYRTYDSYIINDDVPTAKILWCDEALMAHAGDLWMCIVKSKATIVNLFGDTKQIPFVSRVPHFDCKYHIINVEPEEKILVTRRNPKVMMKILQYFYPGVTTTSIIEGDVGVKKIPKIGYSLMEADCYLTFTKAEKAELIDANYSPVLTVHESQGKTFTNVVVVRLHMQDIDIFFKDPYLLVAMTRHRDKLFYCTVNTNDSMSSILSNKKPKLSDAINNTSQGPVIIKAPSIGTVVKGKVQVTMMARDNLTSDIAQLAVLYQGLTEPSTITYCRSQSVIFKEVTTSLNATVEQGVVQDILDSWYDRRNEIDLIKIKEADVFPLAKEYKIDFGKLLSHKVGEGKYCDPTLITPQFPRYQGSLAETVVSVDKRNLNPPLLHTIRNPELANDIVDVFFNTYIDKVKFAEALNIFDYSNGVFLSDFMHSRTAEQLKMMEGLDLTSFDPTKYNGSIKADVKPVLDNSHLELAASQVIASHSPVVTTMLSNTIRCFTNIIKYSLKENFIINDGVSLDDLEGNVNGNLNGFAEFVAKEIDFGKFDKSQEDLILTVQCKIMEVCKVPQAFCKDWYTWHAYTVILFHNLGISINTKYQRKSGDAMTFIGNTIVTMACLAYVYNGNKLICGIFGGDDSLLFFNTDTDVTDKTDMLAEIFNLIAKIENFPDALYFSSKFVVFVDEYWRVVPDPIKAIVRLGRNDMYCKQHVQLCYESFRDNYKAYADHNVRQAVAKCAKIRYSEKCKVSPRYEDVLTICDFINELLTNEEKFMGLYTADAKTWSRNLPNSIKAGFDKEDYLTSLDDLVFL